jgi:protein-S-isoprenylcysteine O-methyltransferase Ste14
MSELALLALGWAAYFALHSALASLAVKRAVAARWPRFVPAYRLAFNALALLLVLPLLAWTLTHPGPELWRWSGGWRWVADGSAALALIGVTWTLRDYDGSEFLGLRQWRDREQRVEDQESFHLSTLHRFVRHPWYSLGLVLLWTRDMDAARLVAASLATGYVVIGSWLEERKLLVYHGERYRRYRQRVPALVPRPWRWLDAESAARLRSSPRDRS